MLSKNNCYVHRRGIVTTRNGTGHFRDSYKIRDGTYNLVNAPCDQRITWSELIGALVKTDDKNKTFERLEFPHPNSFYSCEDNHC